MHRNATVVYMDFCHILWVPAWEWKEVAILSVHEALLPLAVPSLRKAHAACNIPKASQNGIIWQIIPV
jgi:hypothetical protein